MRCGISIAPLLSKAHGYLKRLHTVSSVELLTLTIIASLSSAHPSLHPGYLPKMKSQVTEYGTWCSSQAVCHLTRNDDGHSAIWLPSLLLGRLQAAIVDLHLILDHSRRTLTLQSSLN